MAGCRLVVSHTWGLWLTLLSVSYITYVACFVLVSRLVYDFLQSDCPSHGGSGPHFVLVSRLVYDFLQSDCLLGGLEMGSSRIGPQIIDLCLSLRHKRCRHFGGAPNPFFEEFIAP